MECEAQILFKLLRKVDKEYSDGWGGGIQPERQYICLRCFVSSDMSRLKNETLSIRTSVEIKQFLRLAAGREHRSVASMIEVLVLTYALGCCQGDETAAKRQGCVSEGALGHWGCGGASGKHG